MGWRQCFWYSLHHFAWIALLSCTAGHICLHPSMLRVWNSMPFKHACRWHYFGKHLEGKGSWERESSCILHSLDSGGDILENIPAHAFLSIQPFTYGLRQYGTIYSMLTLILDEKIWNKGTGLRFSHCDQRIRHGRSNKDDCICCTTISLVKPLYSNTYKRINFLSK